MRLPSAVPSGHGEITVRSYGNRFRVKDCDRMWFKIRNVGQCMRFGVAQGSARGP